MKAILKNITALLQSIPELRYVDEDWGQLDYYSPHFPVLWPCALIDIANADYSNIGKDRTATPAERQEATATLQLRVADLKLSNSSAMTPDTMKEDVWVVEDLLQKIHEKLQGFKPGENTGVLVRTKRSRAKRDDGVQLYNVVYTFGIHNC
jgi:hypothetical protein